MLPLITTLLLLLAICESQAPRTDITDCGEIQIRNANLHPALNGYYQRSPESYNDMPVFEGKTNNDKIRYIWWNKYNEFTRWSIGTEKFSSSIEGFMDNQLNEGLLLGNGRSWHVVSRQEWTIDNDLNIICSRQISAPNTQNVDAKLPPQRGGRPPPGRSQPPQQPNLAQKSVIKVTGARHTELNNIYYPTNQQYDNNAVYKTDGVRGKPIYVFHYSYDNMQRWYIGSTLGSDYDVLAFMDDLSRDLAKDASTQIWSEHSTGPSPWNDNPNLKLVFEANAFQNNNDQKPPPINRDEPPQQNYQQQQQQQSNQQQRTQPQQNNQQQQQQQQRQENKQPPKRTTTAQTEREERRKQMFRRVNKLDLDVESSGKFESGVDVSQEPDIIIAGSDDNDVNSVYLIQPVKYNEKPVYKSQSGSYLYFVRYVGNDAARWQVGQPNGGVKNDQPIAFVNADIEYPYDIATWQAWLVFDKVERDWVRQSKVNTYRGDCVVNVEGALNQEINGEYGIIPNTFQSRPVFERMNEQNQRVTIFFNDGETQFSKWFISIPNAVRYLDNRDTIAFIPSSALTVDGVTDFESWQEQNTAREKRLVENRNLKVTGTCSKVKEHDWKRRRRRRAEERKRKKVIDAQKEQHCPSDITVSNDPGRNTAVVHWQAYNRAALQATGSSEDDYDVVYSDNSVAPGSSFKLGRTAVTYQINDKAGGTAIKCDFIITVKDEEAPNIQCPGDIYLMTDYNKDTATAKWLQPEVFDNSGHEIQLQQIGGPKQAQTLRVGQYMISYEAKDAFSNNAVCNFGLYIVDRQSPKIQNCPQSINIAVYSDQNFAAYPEWDVPTAWDNVDGTSVKVQLIQGVAPGSKLAIPPGEQTEMTTQITYEAIDSSDNAARCGFAVKLYRDTSQTEQDKKHQEYHKKIEETSIVEETEQEYRQHIEKDEGRQDDGWSEQARRLREERELQNKQKRSRAAQNTQRRGHRSTLHQQHVKSEVHDFEESLRIEDSFRDGTNDEAVSSKGKANSKKPMSRAERRKKRREDRERRRKERATKRAGKAGTKKYSKARGNALSMVFWSVVGFLYAMVRPWTWPWLALVPLLAVCCCGMSYCFYSVFSEIGETRRGRRVPKYNSWGYKISNMFNRKSVKQRV